MIFFYNSLFATLCWLLLSCYLIINSRRIKFLKKVKLPPGFHEPSVAVIIAVRNEEAELEKALLTICNLNYSNYKIIIINDRSTDNTSLILQSLSSTHQNLQVISVDNLPAGWIGKTHALFTGFTHANAEYLLFTDADVKFEKDTLTKAISYMQQTKVQHLTILPMIKSRSQVLNAVLATFKIMFDLRYKPWQVSDPASEACLGMGAFNLVKKTAYEAAGTHKRIALHPNDDLQLGYCLKSSGFKQDVLYGNGQVQYEWYTNLQQFVNGLMKNAFSSVNYSFANALIHAFGAFIFFVLPVPVLLFQQTIYSFIMAAVILLSQLALYLLKPALNARWWYIFTIPFAAVIISFIMLKSAVVTIIQGGIYWSGSFYPLSDLRNFNDQMT